MKNNHTTYSIRILVALSLLVSIVTFVASTLSSASNGANIAPLNALDEPAHFIRQISLTTNDLVYSAVTGKIYASTPSRAGSGGNSIAAIDPATGQVTSSTFIGSEPTTLALADDGHNLYAILEGAAAVRRLDVQTNTPGLQFSFNGNYFISDMAVAPGNPNLLAVARQILAISPPGAGVAIFDNGVQRPNVGPDHNAGTEFLAFSASATTLYGFARSGIQTMTIDASGVAATSTSSLSAGGRIKFSNGKLFTSFGQVINPNTGTLLGTFFNVNSQAFVPDASVGRAYYLIPEQFGTATIKAFDINTFLLVDSLTITGVQGEPTSLLRWGANGLAFRTSSNQLFIIQTSLIPSAEPIPTPTPTPSPTPSPSPAAAAFVRQLELGTNDLVHIQATQKLYASVPSSEGSTGNSIAEIDPVTSSISNPVFIGSEPGHLAAASDGQTLYAGLEGASAIRRYNITTHTAGQQFSIGRDDFLGPYFFSDIAVSPGNPSVVAVARRNLCCTPSQEGVAIFDNGVQRLQTGPDHSSGSDFLAFASPSTLYGGGSGSLNTMTVDSAGITLTDTAGFSAGNEIIFSNNLVYGSSGSVIDPSTGDLVGTFSIGGLSECHAIDSPNNRALFLVGQGSNFQIRAFDLTTFLPVGFVEISGINGAPRSLVRWGSNGLAFRTSSRQVFLIETALVNPSVPVPDPTPTPSPSPSPSPVEIPTFVRQLDIRANGIVFSQATQALYASVPSSAGAGGNSIRKITPETGVVGPAVFVGSEPNKMALALDGQTLYVHLDGANAVRRFNVVTETAGLQFNTNSTQPPFDMQVVPGHPQSVALSRRGFSDGVAIFDDGVQLPNTGGGFFPLETIDFGFNASTLYGTSRGDLVKLLVDSSGVTTSTVTSRLVGGDANGFEFSGGRLYSTFGLVVDPEARTWLGLFQGINAFSPALVVDDLLDRAFYAFESGPDVVIAGFDTNTFLPVGSIRLPSVFGPPVNLVRWGANGLAFNTESSSPKVYIVQTDLVSTSGIMPIGLRFEVDSQFASEGSTALVRVIRTGNPAGAISVDFATSNGTATAGADYTATSGTLNFASGELSKVISIPTLTDNIFENGNETFTITLSNSVGASLTMPSTTTVAILDDDPKPSLSLSSNQRVAEGNSGTKTLTFDVTLSNPSVQTVTVDFATANGTAVAGSDYVANSGTLTMPALVTSATFNVSINGDTTVEPNETFTVNLSNAPNAGSIVSSSATVTIDNDDASFQLSSASYTVQEAAGFATVSITRVGDTSRVATVQFATADTSGLQSCTVANAKASERCDYATTGGRFQFEIGETGKTFFIPIVNDALVEGNETLTVNISAAVEATLAAPSTATITIVDNDTVPASQNPVDGVDFFVTQQYIDLLGRLPDSIGFANWTNTLANCPNGGFGEFENPGCDRVHVSSSFFLSDEFRGRGYFAYKFYEVGFDRRPTYAEFVPDMVQVGGAQSPASEILSKAAYTDAFVQRPEFRSRYDALSNSDYVNALETNAEVTLTNKAGLIAALDSDQKTRAQVLREMVELQSVTDKFFIRAFVSMQYFGYLRRDPDTAGFNNWVATLTEDPNNFRHMVFGFIFSDEYRHRFGP